MIVCTRDPKSHRSFIDILFRFRWYEVAPIADIGKAFLQIGIVESDKEFLKFLWFDDVFAVEPKIVRNRFARVIFGVTSSPFLLVGTVRKHTNDFNFTSDFVTKIVDSFFVDDFTVEKAYLLFKKLKLRFLEGHFNIRKWRTNDKGLRKLICDNNTAIKLSKILGVHWNEQSDVFVYDLESTFDQGKDLSLTKRNIRGSHQRCSVTKCVLRNIAKFTGKHLCQSSFFNKVAGCSLQLY